ncbi:hypothetical protein DSL64_00420 [Dyadobacter luteus]|uniref:Uncharacterized protein n=1 Tax=Dyadobacter luteus TaxID=2259619 RepID=A0A3D8YGW4_9BACT|nr:hypothetical protein [Dyadobacter luteus]REA64063.1 hypothetical protein DSL64_00420 [Dyadobacter luteus]
MRYIKDVPSKDFKIGIYQWNNKYIIKVETGMFEQTYKIDQYEVETVEEIEKCIDEPFLRAVAQTFDSMGGQFQATLLRNEVIF